MKYVWILSKVALKSKSTKTTILHVRLLRYRKTQKMFLFHVLQNMEGKKYKIISFESRAFDGCHIDFLSFANDSDFKSFSGLCFSGAYIKKIRIPARVENLNIGLFSYFHDLNEIEISPNNHHFIFYNNEFLLGKSDDKN